MSITDELRDWVSNQYRVNRLRGFAIADRIDAEHEKELEEQFNALTIDMEPMTDENMAEHGWIRLSEDGPEAENAKLRAENAKLRELVSHLMYVKPAEVTAIAHDGKLLQFDEMLAEVGMRFEVDDG